MVNKPKASFARSKEFKQFFSQHFELWKTKNRLGMHELAERCGVTSSYLSQVTRYGRVPSKPVLILLALNFELSDPHEIFRVASLEDIWPFDSKVSLSASTEQIPGFLSLKLDMNGFTDAIRTIVRHENRSRSLTEITQGKPIRFGFNQSQYYLFTPTEALPEGLFPELVRLLSTALNVRVEPINVPFAESIELLKRGEIDLFGPLYPTPQRISQALFTRPFCEIAISAVGRKVSNDFLECSTLPNRMEDITRGNYRVVVLKDSNAHHFAALHLDSAKHPIIVCDDPDGALDRVLTKTGKKAAHLMICDSVIAIDITRANPDTTLLFQYPDNLLTRLGNCIAVRPDWAEMSGILDKTLSLVLQGEFLSQVQTIVPPEFRGLVTAPSASM